MSQETEFIRRWVAERNAVPVSDVSETVDLYEAGLVDSLGIFSIVTELESEFNIVINQEELLMLERISIASIESLLRGKVAS